MTSRKPHIIPFREALKVWLKVAALSFGGPAGQIAVMHRILVDEKRWIPESRFLHALNYCMLLPGPEAQQLATYIGWLLHKAKGGLVAGSLFVLPGFLSILALSVLYAGFGELKLVQALFFGVKAAVLAVVIEALLRIGKRALKTLPTYAIAVASFIAIFFLDLPFPLIILAAGAIGLLGGRFAPRQFIVIREMEVTEDPGQSRNFHTVEPTLWRAFKVGSLWLGLWLAPVIALFAVFGLDNVFTQVGVFFSKLAVVTFGGAYAVLAYMAQQAVEAYGWLAPGEMLDGLGMAETTPGPLIQVVQFVAFLGAFRQADGIDPYLAGVLASLLATWVTFTPSFLWIFLGAPYVEKLHGRPVLSAGLSAITAAVVGVILNLAIWFALHVLFAHVAEVRTFGLRLYAPEWATIEWAALVLSALSFIALLRLRIGMIPVIFGAAVFGMIYSYLF